MLIYYGRKLTAIRYLQCINWRHNEHDNILSLFTGIAKLTGGATCRQGLAHHPRQFLSTGKAGWISFFYT